MRDKKAKAKHFSSAYWFSLPQDLLVPAGAHQQCQRMAVPSCQPLPHSLSALLLLHLWPWMTRSWQTGPAALQKTNPRLLILYWESWSTAHVSLQVVILHRFLPCALGTCTALKDNSGSHSSEARLGCCFHNISKWSDFPHGHVSQRVSFLRHWGTSGEISPALTLSDFAKSSKDNR